MEGWFFFYLNRALFYFSFYTLEVLLMVFPGLWSIESHP